SGQAVVEHASFVEGVIVVEAAVRYHDCCAELPGNRLAFDVRFRGHNRKLVELLDVAWQRLSQIIAITDRDYDAPELPRLGRRMTDPDATPLVANVIVSCLDRALLRVQRAVE